MHHQQRASYLSVPAVAIHYGTQLGANKTTRGCDEGHLPVVERLVAAGATGLDGPLYNAAGQGHLPVVERLAAAGADINNMLRLAARTDAAHIVVNLLLAGATDVDGALREAARERLLPMVERLLAAGALVAPIHASGDLAIPFSTRAETDFFCLIVGLADTTRPGQPERLNDALGYVFAQLARENRLVHSHTSTLETRKTHARGARYALRACEALLARGATHATYDPDVMYAARAYDYGHADDE